MSGAEAALVLGLVASTYTIFEAAYQVYKAAHDAKGMTKSCRTATEQIPLILHTLQLIENGLTGAQTAEDVVKSVQPVLQRCKEKAGLVQDIFDKALPSKDASRRERYTKAVEARWRSGEVRSSVDAVMQDLALLQQYQVFQDAETLEDIKNAIDELAALEDDEDDDDAKGARQIHSGSGNINTHTGSGNQENHTYTNSGAGDFYYSKAMTINKVENLMQSFNVDSAHLSSRTRFFLVPRSINRYFIGRQNVLDVVKAHVAACTTDQGRQIRMAITGIAGIGKSEICLKLADMVRESVGSVFWVDVSERLTAEAAFVSIARRFGRHPQSLEEALQDLGAIEQSWLLILDNADDPRVDYSAFFPPGTRGAVILTSRNVECGHAYGRDHWEQLEALDGPTAAGLLLQAARLSQSARSREVALQVVETLSYHTLAIVLAGSYIAKGHCGLEAYPDLYRRQWRRTVAYANDQEKSRYGSVLATLEASMTLLENQQHEKYSDAIDMLHLLGCFSSSPMPVAMLQLAWRGMAYVGRSDTTTQIEVLSKWQISAMPGLLSEDSDTYRLTEASELLQNLSLIAVSGSVNDRILSVHPLIHDWIWRRQQRQQMERSWVSAGSLLSLSLYHLDHPYPHDREFRIHIQSFVKKRLEFGLWPALGFPRLQILYRCAEALDDLRVDELALRCLEEIIHELGLDFNDIREEHLQLCRLLARSLLRNGDSSGSVCIWKAIVSVEKTLQGNDRERLASQHALAGAYESDGRAYKAVRMLEEVVRARNQNLPEVNMSRLASQHELARMYEATGQSFEAMPLLEHVVRVRESILAEDHPDRLASQHALAAIYAANRRIPEAITMLEHVVCVRDKMLEDDHPDRLASHHELARAYETDDQVEKAISLLENVVRIEGKLADDHPDKLASQHVLARLYREHGSVEQAIELFEHIVLERKRSNPPEHPDRIASEHELTLSYEARSTQAVLPKQ